MSLRDDFNFSQTNWPGDGGPTSVNDCWVIAALRAMHAVAPWERLVGVKVFREAAGAPDVPGPDGYGTIAQTAKGLRTLYPRLEFEAHPRSDGFLWSAFAAKVKEDRPAVLFLRSGALPEKYRFGFSGGHAVAVAFESGDWWISNALDRPHAKADKIDAAALRDAARALYGDGSINCVLMPTEAEAFTTHPLYVDPAPLQAEIAALQAKIAAAQEALG